MDIAVTDRMERFDARQVEVGGLIGDRIERTARNNLLAIDWDGEFLQPFRDKASAKGFYVGLGKSAEGLVRLAHYSQDPELLQLRQHVVAEIVAAQSADGYLGTYPAENRILPAWDVHEMAYLLLALVTDFRCFGEAPSLAAARKLADYLLAALPDETIHQVGRDKPGGAPPDWPDGVGLTTTLATIGIDRAMLALYHQTGMDQALRCCTDNLRLPDWSLGIVEGRRPPIEGHIYAYLTRCLAQLELHDITTDPRLLTQTRRAMDFLLSSGGLVVTGSAGVGECWDSAQTGTGELGETCATAYLIRILDKLGRMDGDLSRGDLQERAIYNALFAAQSPGGRHLRYYTPFEGQREYWDRDTYCCPGNFRRIISELPEMVYYRDGQGVAVNLYCPSRLTAEIRPGLALELVQETDCPNSGRVAVHVNPQTPARFAVRLRKPAWCQEYALAVNGEEVCPPVLSGSLCIERQWQAGDTISLEMRMPWRMVRGFAKQAGRVAVLRGPMLFGLNPSRNVSLEPKDIDQLEIDPISLGEPIQDDSVRPSGLVCPLAARGSSGRQLELVLSEFADPGIEATYFPTKDLDAAVADELLAVPGVS